MRIHSFADKTLLLKDVVLAVVAPLPHQVMINARRSLVRGIRRNSVVQATHSSFTTRKPPPSFGLMLFIEKWNGI